MKLKEIKEKPLVAVTYILIAICLIISTYLMWQSCNLSLFKDDSIENFYKVCKLRPIWTIINFMSTIVSYTAMLVIETRE